MSYQHLTLEERYCPAEFREKGLSIRAIARMLKRSPSTISRELRRNRGKIGYHPYGAYSKAKHRRRMPRRLLKGFEAEKLEYVMRALSEWHWSPEQIAGRWRKEHPDSVLSCSTLYRHIKRGLLPGISAKEHLRRRGRRRVKRRANYNTIHPERIIPEWPEEIRKRERIGDWEGDTLCGGEGKGGAVTLVDRKSGLICGWVVHSRQARETRNAIVEALKDKPIKSLSLDNGSEFAEFRELEEQLKAPIFFAEETVPNFV